MKVIRLATDDNAERAERLLDAVQQGRKTVTCTLACDYGLDNDVIDVGERVLLTDAEGNPQLVLEITGKTLVPFGQVDAATALAANFDSLESFRKAHALYWQQNPPRLGPPGWRLTETTPVVIESFRLVEDQTLDDLVEQSQIWSRAS